ncbi:pre-rRNA-processing protein RIX1 [Parastagonospora nodorum]|nr:pre-rRNA-processing protein RIX1 [Parastagonospora nodorum]KAH4077306.1 pre-rRNA-processing protein RIX1 [Parastagonospora nodorum]KAH5207721.1 pre-rRNA-processing protein RIX1 [Parastagonospora nodorum]KAH5341794.1 pre-rRNA-processing protein RIX1 [Parastagonospora nodorum]KAH5347791.1 pre-rRNA-processing protein RIX1 [Parastagonospora nodorum]
MAPITSELATLRALTFRISSTATAQLPQHVPAIAASLVNCRTLLCSPQAAVSKTSSESSVAVHKYRTLLSTLLQDRTVQGRWSAIVLIKATIEIGGWETLQKCLPWVRGLLGTLSKPEPPSSKKLCIITLTRIFILTREYPTLVREITTPSLPGYIQSALQLAIKAPAALLQTILESFNELLPRHPTMFRSYLKQIHPLLARLIAPTPSNRLGAEQIGPKLETTSGVVLAAQRLYVQIPSCAAKGASGDEWEKSLKTTINAAHRVADKIFRAVFEDWKSSAREPTTNGHTLDDEVQDVDASDMALPSWSGIFAGSERLVRLLQLAQQYLASSTANSVGINISSIMDMITRMLSLTVPGSGSKAYQNNVKLNNQISKDERENLWLVLPDIHVATIELLLVLTSRSQSSTLSLDALIIDQIVWTFTSEKDSIQLRGACYRAIAKLLQRSGAGLSKSSVDSLVPLMRACCDDLLPLESASTKAAPSQNKTNGISAQTTANADTFLNSKSAVDTASSFFGLREAAEVLLPVLLSGTRAQYLSDALRSRLDRTATLTQNKDAMVASVLNPPPSKKFGKPAASIIPLIARSFPASNNVEGMLRPRMPVIRLGTQDTEAEEDGIENEESEEDEEAEAEAEEEGSVMERDDESFMGNKLDNILESEGRANTDTRDFAMPDALITEAKDHESGSTDLPVPSPRELRSSVRSQNQSKEFAKRAQTDAAPSSPSKRLKTSKQEQTITSAASPLPALTPQASETPRQTVVLPQTSDFTVTSTASAVPDLPEPGDAAADENDSDGDDVVSLVLGQDTDDESE